VGRGEVELGDDEVEFDVLLLVEFVEFPVELPLGDGFKVTGNAVVKVLPEVTPTENEVETIAEALDDDEALLLPCYMVRGSGTSV
jgi:hypothetical protein